MSNPRILIVEDNEDLAFGLQTNLEYEGYQVETETDGARGLSRAQDGDWNLLILDLMLPGLDGLQLLRCLRKHDPHLPVLILSARSEEADKVLGFQTGADDYVTKPFGVLELMARVEALLRRHRRENGYGNGHPHLPDTAANSWETGNPWQEPSRTNQATATPIRRFGQVEVDAGRRVVKRNGEPVSLTPRELDLLLALLRRNGRAASRKELLAEVWKDRVSSSSRTVDTHMAELRKKLEESPSHPCHLLTVRKVGYRLQP